MYELLDTAVRSRRPAILGRGSCGAEDCLAKASFYGHSLVNTGHVSLCGDIHGMSGIYPDNLEGRRQFVAIWSAAIKALDEGDALLMMACNAAHKWLLEWAPHVRVFSDSKTGWDNIGFVAVQAARSPQLCEAAWTRVFAERTVMVIHPFVNTLSCQLQRQGRVHACRHILPMSATFKLVPMTVALGLTPHGSFNETLHATFDQIDAAGAFDIAVIGAGAYSMPIAQYVPTPHAAHTPRRNYAFTASRALCIHCQSCAVCAAGTSRRTSGAWRLCLAARPNSYSASRAVDGREGLQNKQGSAAAIAWRIGCIRSSPTSRTRAGVSTRMPARVRIGAALVTLNEFATRMHVLGLGLARCTASQPPPPPHPSLLPPHPLRSMPTQPYQHHLPSRGRCRMPPPAPSGTTSFSQRSMRQLQILQRSMRQLQMTAASLARRGRLRPPVREAPAPLHLHTPTSWPATPRAVSGSFSAAARAKTRAISRPSTVSAR